MGLGLAWTRSRHPILMQSTELQASKTQPEEANQQNYIIVAPSALGDQAILITMHIMDQTLLLLLLL